MSRRESLTVQWAASYRAKRTKFRLIQPAPDGMRARSYISCLVAAEQAVDRVHDPIKYLTGTTQSCQKLFTFKSDQISKPTELSDL